MTETLLSIKEASRLLGVCENTLRDWDENGKFKASRTEGNHRRYSLEQIREYLEANPKDAIFTETEPTSEVGKLVRKWATYLEEVEDKSDRRTLSVLLDNIKLLYDSDGYRSQTFSSEEMCWLTKEGWLRCRFRKMVSVQPMLRAVNLVYYLNNKTGSLTLESKGIAASTILYNFKCFTKAKFEEIKNIYADAIAAELEHQIIQHLPLSDIENIMDSTFVADYFLKDAYDYIMAPEKNIAILKKRNSLLGVDLYPIPVALDPESFKIRAVLGKYPISWTAPPIFAPYILFTVGPNLAGEVCSAFSRSGWFTEE